jgi:hypothetical protein
MTRNQQSGGVRRKGRISGWIHLLLLPVLTVNPFGAVAAENQITLVTLKSSESPEGIFLNLVYTEAFKRLGITFHYQQSPSKRASFLSDSGEVDGELSRIYSYNETHPNLIRVEEPHWHSGFLAVAKDPAIQLNGWQSLSNTPYKVTCKRGVHGCELNLPKVVRPENLERVETTSQGFKKLLAGWTDLFVASGIDILCLLESDEFKDSGLRVAGVMEEFSSHAFLHKKHQELAIQLSTVLADMKKEGLFEDYWKAAKLKAFLETKQDWVADEE